MSFGRPSSALKHEGASNVIRELTSPKRDSTNNQTRFREERKDVEVRDGATAERRGRDER